MKKLELKHIVPYLPYGLYMKLSPEGVFNLDSEYPNEHAHKVGKLTYFGVDGEDVNGGFKVSDKSSFDFESLSEVILALRPLSDLTKEIEHDGVKFIPINLLSERCRMHHELFGLQNMIDLRVVDYQKLLEWNFDIFNLIEDKLAVDINTLK